MSAAASAKYLRELMPDVDIAIFEMADEVYLTQSVFKVVLQMSTPPQIRQLILYYHYHSLPHKSVSVSSTITDIKNKLTDFCEN